MILVGIYNNGLECYFSYFCYFSYYYDSKYLKLNLFSQSLGSLRISRVFRLVILCHTESKGLGLACRAAFCASFFFEVFKMFKIVFFEVFKMFKILSLMWPPCRPLTSLYSCCQPSASWHQQTRQKCSWCRE